MNNSKGLLGLSYAYHIKIWNKNKVSVFIQGSENSSFLFFT